MSGKVEINKLPVPYSALTSLLQRILRLSPHLRRMFHKGGVYFPNRSVAGERIATKTGVQNSQKTKKCSQGP